MRSGGSCVRLCPPQVRLALAHWIGGVLARCFSAWRAHALRRVHLKDRLTAALVHWYRHALARAFGAWKEWALRKVRAWGLGLRAHKNARHRLSLHHMSTLMAQGAHAHLPATWSSRSSQAAAPT